MWPASRSMDRPDIGDIPCSWNLNAMSNNLKNFKYSIFSKKYLNPCKISILCFIRSLQALNNSKFFMHVLNNLNLPHGYPLTPNNTQNTVLYMAFGIFWRRKNWILSFIQSNSQTQIAYQMTVCCPLWIHHWTKPHRAIHLLLALVKLKWNHQLWVRVLLILPILLRLVQIQHKKLHQRLQLSCCTKKLSKILAMSTP